MRNTLADAIRRTCHYLLDHSINLYSLERQPWGRAASAEVRVMPSLFATVSWTVGALWMAFKSYVRRLMARPSDLFLGNNSFLRLSWRSLSPLLLMLTLALFLVPQFREALATTTSMWIAGDGLAEMSNRKFQSLEALAERQHDAQTLAFLALRARDKQNRSRLAEQAVSLDPKLTWIFAESAIWDHETLPVLPQWFERVERWDPDNSMPFMLHAQCLAYSIQLAKHQDTRTALAGLQSNSEFRRLMERAFAAPRYDSYLFRRFELDRQVVLKHGIAGPILLLNGLQRQRVPSMFDLEVYAGWLMKEAADQIKAGDAAAAARKYRQIIAAGEHMETQFSTWPERFTGFSLQQMAGKELIPILRQQGKVDEAATLDDLFEQERQSWLREDILLATLLDPSNVQLDRPDPFNPGIIIHLSALLFVLLLALLAAVFLYLRLRHSKHGGGILLPRSISYAPLILFTAAVVLLVTYLPYARIFRMYITDARLLHLHMVGRGMPHHPDSGVDLGLFSSLSNLQYPFRFVQGPDVWLIISVSFIVVLALGFYMLSRARVSAASA